MKILKEFALLIFKSDICIIPKIWESPINKTNNPKIT